MEKAARRAGDALGHRSDTLPPSGPCSKTPTMPANKRDEWRIRRNGVGGTDGKDM